MYIDTHCHLALSQFDEDRDTFVERYSNDKDLVALIEVSVDYKTTETMLRLFDGQEKFYYGLGMHPHSAESFEPSLFDYYRKLIASNKRIIAVGEIGLDNKSPVPFDKQFDVYKQCVDFAREVNKPLIIHSRGHDDEILKPLRNFENNIVFHCYSSGPELAKEALDLGAYLSFSGIVTFPSANAVRKALKITPLDRILAETDSPYLAPQNIRGKRNSPDRVKDIIEYIAKIKGISAEDMSNQIVENASKAFLLPI